MQVVAEVELIDIIEDDLDAVWETTKEYAGITHEYFEKYFKGKETAIAYKLGAVKKYSKPKCLASFGIKNAPQSFVYVGVNA
jgi:predicted transcriptional regulator